MAIWISRYSNKELQSGKYYPVGISIGTPKFPLGYTLRKPYMIRCTSARKELFGKSPLHIMY